MNFVLRISTLTIVAVGLASAVAAPLIQSHEPATGLLLDPSPNSLPIPGCVPGIPCPENPPGN
ncbi:MAG: hypothetical protein ABSE51_04000 [Terracidiphilus sp.]|jgi:hypothetical protein